MSPSSAGTFCSNDVTAKAVPFRDFAVRASEFLGDAGELEHQDDGFIEQSTLDVDAADFTVYANVYQSLWTYRRTVGLRGHVQTRPRRPEYIPRGDPK